ncbi:MAG: hypothetical protein WEC75_14345 [Dehalococcoidia bacterium]
MNRITMLAAAAVLTVGILATSGAGAPARAQQPIDPAAFSPAITNPLYPLSLIGPKVFEGEDIDPDTGDVIETRLESRVLPQTKVVAGVTVTVLEEKAFEEGEVVELALDYFAQHRDGSVYYFGEAVDNYEGGQLKDHHGQWLAGEDGNQPGIIMPAQPVAGQTFEQELAPGVAEDKATVLALNETVTVPARNYTGCLKTREFSPIEPGVEELKWHCPGAGLVKEEGDGSLSELVSVAAAPAASPTTAPTPSSPTPRGVVAPNAGDGSGTGDAAGPPGWVIAVGVGALALALGPVVIVRAAAARRLEG